MADLRTIRIIEISETEFQVELRINTELDHEYTLHSREAAEVYVQQIMKEGTTLIRLKMCSRCEEFKDPKKDFHKTLRYYELSSGLEKRYEYYHKKCKLCRNEEKKVYLRRKNEKAIRK